MNNHQAGLHKDVAKIFNGVWIPEKDNIQSAKSTVHKDSGAYINPKPLANDIWPERVKLPKRARQSSPWSFLSPKARREKKRLSAISKHLLIKLPE